MKHTHFYDLRWRLVMVPGMYQNSLHHSVDQSRVPLLQIGSAVASQQHVGISGQLLQIYDVRQNAALRSFRQFALPDRVDLRLHEAIQRALDLNEHRGKGVAQERALSRHNVLVETHQDVHTIAKTIFPIFLGLFITKMYYYNLKKMYYGRRQQHTIMLVVVLLFFNT